MMQIEPLTQGKFTTSGSSVLKMMQNNSLPALDLIVRESIQNSMDAAIPSSKRIFMQFQIGEFFSDKLANEFDVIGNNLKNKFGNTPQKFLAIRDQNTIGLTGDLAGNFKPGEKNQNLGKLVFHVMKPQDKEGAGGSWGIGKTVYYRLGVGLVIYYSRIKEENGKFQERLVAALVENENDNDGLLNSIEQNLGVAFFGEKGFGNHEIKAITDENVIHEFLTIFDILPFDGTNTGTTIIIPYVNQQALISNNVTENTHKTWWQTDIENYLKVSILRWYFPRLCENYPIQYGPKLSVMINNEIVKIDNNVPLFKKYMSLYDACYNDKKEEWITKVEITRQKNVENNVIGYFAYGKVTKDELDINKQGLPSPYQYCLLDESDDSKNSPIIAFTRKPGMIVNYETEGKAVGSLKSENNEFIIGIFSLNSPNNINNPHLNLDEYIRQSEKSDHTSWVDHSIPGSAYKIQIVGNIYNKIKEELSRNFGITTPTTGEASINKNFAKKFGKLLLPDENFGTSGSSRRAGGRAGGGALKTKKQNIIEFKERKFEKGAIILEYKFTLAKPFKRVNAVNCVNTINGPIDPIKYENMGLDYPCSIEDAFASVVIYNSKSLPANFKKLMINDNIECYKFTFKITGNNKNYGFDIETNNNEFIPIIFTIRMRIRTDDPFLSTYFDFAIEED